MALQNRRREAWSLMSGCSTVMRVFLDTKSRATTRCWRGFRTSRCIIHGRPFRMNDSKSSATGKSGDGNEKLESGRIWIKPTVERLSLKSAMNSGATGRVLDGDGTYS